MSADYLNAYKHWLYIRNTSLKPYVQEHITTDYVEFTESLLAEFVEGLSLIPEFDPNSFVLPVDPFDTLNQLYKLDSLPQSYDAGFQTTKDAIDLIKGVIQLLFSTEKCKSDKAVCCDDYGPNPKDEHFTPILTRRSRLATPKPGKKKGKLPKSIGQLVNSKHKLEFLDVEPIQEPKVDFEDTLKLKLDLDPNLQQDVRTFTSKTLLSIIDPKHRNKHLSLETLRTELPSQFIKSTFDNPFVPIFPRSRRHGTSVLDIRNPIGPLKTFQDLVQGEQALKSLPVIDPDGDIAKQNMRLVDGWETIASSAPSTPSAKSDQVDELEEEIHMPSTPDTTPPFAFELERLKMDPILFPRSRRVGGTEGIKPHILQGKTLETFLGSLLSTSTIQSAPDDYETTKSKLSDAAVPYLPLDSLDELSLLGQPPSIEEEIHQGHEKQTHEPKTVIDLAELDVDDEIESFYETHRAELDDMKKAIFDERIEGVQDPLMEVPKLPEPPDFPKDLFIPTCFSDFIVPPITKDDKGKVKNAALPPYQFLKKAKGCQSLGLALSWVTFTTDKKLPSVLEITDVVDLMPSNSEEYAKALQLLESLSLDNQPAKSSKPQSWNDDLDRFYTAEDDLHLSCIKKLDCLNDFHLVFSRQERQRLARLEGRIDGHSVDDTDEVPTDDFRDEDIDTHHPQGQLALPSKRSHERISGTPPPEEPNLDSDEFRSPKKVRLDDNLEYDEQKPYEDPQCQHYQYNPADYEDYDSGYGEMSSQEHYMQDPPYDNFAESHHQDYGFQHPELDDADKENWPPSSSPLHSDYRHPMAMAQHRTDICDDATAQPYDPVDTMAIDHLEEAHGLTEVASAGAMADFLHDAVRIEELDASCTTSQHLQAPTGLDFDQEPNFVSHALGIAAFAQLRAKKISQPEPSVCPSSSPSVTLPAAPQAQGRPDELVDASTLLLPSVTQPPQYVHKYLASLEFIQKHALARVLNSEKCLVDLVERPTLGGVDIIIDTNNAVFFINLFYLPARGEAYIKIVAEQSWKFRRLLVVFEGYSDKAARKTTKKMVAPAGASEGPSGFEAPPEASAYTPPIIKAIKRFRRDLNIAAGCGTKDPNTSIQYSFADNVENAALLTRHYGDLAQGSDETEGAIWNERTWLDWEYLEEDETNLASLRGLNHFSSCIVLCQTSIDDFINASPERRLTDFGGLIGHDNMMACNEDIACRFSALRAASDVVSDLDAVDATYTA